MKRILTLSLTLLLFCSGIFAQTISKKLYSRVDDFVQKLGPLTSMNVAIVADTLTRGFADKEDKARAIFYWIANNIALDPKAIKGNDTRNTLPELVMQNRKTTPLGFSLLVQEMCSDANIRCLSVDGYIKNFPEDIGNKPDELNHSWNVVQLGQSPEEWYYVDAAKASGFLDKKMSLFTRYFTSEYFFADKPLFNLDHFPDNSAWQLGPGPKGLKDFYALPVISNAAYEHGMSKPTPAAGFIKTKITGSVAFSFGGNGKKIALIELIIGDNRKQQKPVPMNFEQSGGLVSFKYQFKVADTYPVRIMVDGKELLAYNVQSDE